MKCNNAIQAKSVCSLLCSSFVSETSKYYEVVQRVWQLLQGDFIPCCKLPWVMIWWNCCPAPSCTCSTTNGDGLRVELQLQLSRDQVIQRAFIGLRWASPCFSMWAMHLSTICSVAAHKHPIVTTSSEINKNNTLNFNPAILMLRHNKSNMFSTLSGGWVPFEIMNQLNIYTFSWCVAPVS